MAEGGIPGSKPFDPRGGKVDTGHEGTISGGDGKTDTPTKPANQHTPEQGPTPAQQETYPQEKPKLEKGPPAIESRNPATQPTDKQTSQAPKVSDLPKTEAPSNKNLPSATLVESNTKPIKTEQPSTPVKTGDQTGGTQKPLEQPVSAPKPAEQPNSTARTGEQSSATTKAPEQSIIITQERVQAGHSLEQRVATPSEPKATTTPSTDNTQSTSKSTTAEMQTSSSSQRQDQQLIASAVPEFGQKQTQQRQAALDATAEAGQKHSGGEPIVSHQQGLSEASGKSDGAHGDRQHGGGQNGDVAHGDLQHSGGHRNDSKFDIAPGDQTNKEAAIKSDATKADTSIPHKDLQPDKSNPTLIDASLLVKDQKNQPSDGVRDAGRTESQSAAGARTQDSQAPMSNHGSIDGAASTKGEPSTGHPTSDIAASGHSNTDASIAGKHISNALGLNDSGDDHTGSNTHAGEGGIGLASGRATPFEIKDGKQTSERTGERVIFSDNNLAVNLSNKDTITKLASVLEQIKTGQVTTTDIESTRFAHAILSMKDGNIAKLEQALANSDSALMKTLLLDKLPPEVAEQSKKLGWELAKLKTDNANLKAENAELKHDKNVLEILFAKVGQLFDDFRKSVWPPHNLESRQNKDTQSIIEELSTNSSKINETAVKEFVMGLSETMLQKPDLAEVGLINSDSTENTPLKAPKDNKGNSREPYLVKPEDSYRSIALVK
ncbi:MAG: hypothetical protein K2X81_24865, partial [Candidatus Obscuribacterales bacterium]|nr:hypothetical protein [Candidatus Obscuribacterales bacterium]